MADKIPGTSILAGEDSIGRERARERLFAQVRASASTVTVEVYDPDREDLAQYLERMMTGSIFLDVKICHVRHASRFGREELGALADFAGYRIPEVYLVVEADDLGATPAAAKVFGAWLDDIVKKSKKDKGIQVAVFSKPRDYEMAKWLVSQTPVLFKRKIDLRDAEYFIDLVGYSFDRIYSELQKLDIFLDAGKPVDRKAIDDVIEAGRSKTPQELAQALGRRDLVRALEVIDSLFSANFYAPICISSIFNHFWSLFRVRCFLDAEPEKARQFQHSYDRDAQNALAFEIGCSAGLLAAGQEKRVFPVMVKPGIIGQAQNFPAARLRGVFRLLRDMDVGVKTGRIQVTKTLFQLLCFQVAGEA